MHFHARNVKTFEELFDRYKEQIRNQPGCTFLELYQDLQDPCEFYTYSHWKNEESLNKYRYSALFKEIWPATKALFDKKPTAKSVIKKHSLS